MVFPEQAGTRSAHSQPDWDASCHDAVSNDYYAKKRAEGKKHNAAVICLARRRLNVMSRYLLGVTVFRQDMQCR